MHNLNRFLRRLVGGAEQSGTTARKRLQLVLVHDRTGLSLSSMESMKQDLLEVVSRYLVIDPASVQMEVRRSGDSVILVSNILVKEVMRSTATS